jgi:hypothetical protein
MLNEDKYSMGRIMALSARQIANIQQQLEAKRKTVAFDSYDLSVRQVLDMISTSDIFVPPEYQRQFIWDKERQSALVESILLGIPVPSLFLAMNADSTWEVVDGVQRLGSLCHFVGSETLLAKINREEPLELGGLEKLDSFNEVTFEALPRSIQLMFFNRPIRLTVLNDRSDLAIRFDLFERLNTGGISLTPQEIRNCVYRGVFNEEIKELANDEDFRRVVKIAEKKASNGTYEEMVLRFFAYLNNYQAFDHLVKNFLNDYMNEHRNRPISRLDRTLFQQSIRLLAEAFPNGITRGRQSTPVNVYEGLSVGLALALQAGKHVNVRRLQAVIDDAQFRTFTGAGSNQRRFVIGRIELVRDAL